MRGGPGITRASLLALAALAGVRTHMGAQASTRPVPHGVPAAPTPSLPTALSAFSKRKAETLLHNVLPCLGCHTLDGDGGRIGPDLTTVAERRSAEYIAAMLDDPQEVMPGSAMPRPRLDDNTHTLLARYLATRDRTSAAAAITTLPPHTHSATKPVRDGRTLYAVYCAACHGASGRGDGPNAAYLPVKPAVHASAEKMSTRSDDALFDTIAGGGAIMNRSPRMPAFGGTLSPLEIRSLVKHIRNLCRCSGPAWSTDRGGTRPGSKP